MREFLKKVKGSHWVVLLLAVLFFPFPTEMVPEWKIRFTDDKGIALSERVVEQSWKSYTYFAADGYDQRCTDNNGSITFPGRYLWSGLFARLTSPILAKVLIIAHGSEGTSASVRLFDRYYSSKDYYWDDRMSLYLHDPDGIPPDIGVASSREPYTNLPTCETIR